MTEHTKGGINNKLVSKYISGYSGEVKSNLLKIRGLIADLVPEADEEMSYGIPTFNLNGKHMVHYAAFKNNIGFYPTPSGIEAFKDRLDKYKWSKGSVQFPFDKPIPYDLIKEMTLFREKEIKKVN